MIRALRKTLRRCSSFLRGALLWRGPERQYIFVAWSLLAGLAWVCTYAVLRAPGFSVLVVSLYLAGNLAAVCAIDSRYGIIPNGLVVGLAVGALFEISLLRQAEFFDHAIAAATVFAVECILRGGYRRLRGYDGFGFGDVKFMTAAVLWVSLASMPSLLLIAVASAFISLWIIRLDGHSLDGKYAIPFGPHLAIGLWWVWILQVQQVGRL